MPSFAQLTGQAPVTEEIHAGAADKLLRRPALDSELSGGADAYKGRVVLISGAGGSIGSELCRQIASCAPKALFCLKLVN